MALTKKDIAQAGLRLLNRVGLEGLTVRAIADELGVKAPALYWHLKNKQELLDELASEMFRTIPALPPASADERWADRVLRQARDVRQMMLSYRDGAKVFSGTFSDDPLPGESAIEEIVAAGHTPAEALRVLSTVFSFTVGFTIEQQAVEPMPGKRDPRYQAALERSRRSAASSAAIQTALSADFDEQFEEGLQIVALGVQAWLESA